MNNKQYGCRPLANRVRHALHRIQCIHTDLHARPALNRTRVLMIQSSGAAALHSNCVTFLHDATSVKAAWRSSTCTDPFLVVQSLIYPHELLRFSRARPSSSVFLIPSTSPCPLRTLRTLAKSSAPLAEKLCYRHFGLLWPRRYLVVLFQLDMIQPRLPSAPGWRVLLNGVLIAVTLVILLNGARNKPYPPTVPSLTPLPVSTIVTSTTATPTPIATTNLSVTVKEPQRIHGYPIIFFRPLESEVNCDLVFAQLRHLYEDSKARQSAWSRAGHDVHVVAREGIHMTELHIFVVGDSWGERHAWGLFRLLDLCRMRLPRPLVPRDECSLIGAPLHESGTMYQLSKAALGFEKGSTEEAGFLRISVHFIRNKYSVTAASMAASILLNETITPSSAVAAIPVSTRCRLSLDEEVEAVKHLVPRCLCADTVDLPGATEVRSVPVDALQLVPHMWDVYVPTEENNLFSFKDPRVDWFTQQKHFSPNLTKFPFITWEENLGRVAEFIRDKFTVVVRNAVRSVTVPDGVSMPRVVLSVIPRGNCSGRGFTVKRTLHTTARCKAMTRPLHDLMHDATLAAYGKPLLGLPAFDPPEWLRLVDYRTLVATEYPEHYNNTGASVAPGTYLCTMSDGVHLDTAVFKPRITAPHIRWCTSHAHSLFWERLYD